jgi:RHS repeat-associated protein
MKALESLKNIGNLTVQEALQIAKNHLKNFALSPNFKTQMQIALGNLKNWATTDLRDFPKIEVRPGAEINQAKGAFAAARNTIYLSQELVDQNRGNVDDIASVLLEEYGHYLDSQVNPIDSPGDEGAIFADLVQGKELSQGELAALKTEDDSAIVVLDGEKVGIEQSNNNIQVSINAPRGVRPNGKGEVTVTYTNVGQTDAVAPLLTLSAQGALLQSSGGNVNQLQFLGINNQGAAGILPPGASSSFKVSFQPTGEANTDIKFSAGVVAENAPIDWNSIKNDARPNSISADAWDVIWNNFTGSVGNTAGQYQAVLADNATRLSQLGDYSNDVSRLLAFELQQAGNYGSINQRYSLSSLGRGSTFPFDITATEDSNGNVTVKSSGGLRLFRKQADGNYLNQPGDTATLTKVGNTFQLRAQGGGVLAFWPDGKLDFIEDTNSNRLTATYTGNQLTRIDSTNGDNVNFSYNDQGRISQVVDQAGRTTTYSYDPTGELLLSITEPQGTTSYTYNQAKALTSVTFADGTQTFYEYDAQGRVIKQSLNGGAEAITFEYDSAGGVTATNSTGAKTKLLLNDLGQIGQLQDPLGRNLQFKYDANGNLIQQIAPGNISSNFTYDQQSNLLNQVDPQGNQIKFTYDPTVNQLQSVSDQRGNVTGYNYDDKGNLAKIEYVPSSDEQLNYQQGNVNGLVSNRTFGRLDNLINSNGTNPTVSYYDKNGKLITSKVAYTNESIKDQFNYDSQGNLVKYVNRRGQGIEYTYDDRERLIKQTNPDGSQINFTYDQRDNLIAATDAKGTIHQEFDSADRLTKITYPNGRFLQYTYDAGGRRTRMVDQDGFAVNYGYDSVGRLAGLTDSNGQKTVSYTYDSVGRLSREDKGNGTYTTYGYDTAGQLLNIVNYAPNASVNSRFDYTYDQLGRRTSMTTLEGTSKYGYDANGQLISVTLPDNRTIQYQYDAAGNRIAVTDNGVATSYETNSLNQYTAVGKGNYTYDADGNLISKTEGGKTSTYTYDAENRLVGVVTPDGIWSYDYDAFGNRIATTKNGQRTEYLLDPTGLGNVIDEYSNGNLIAHYTHGLGLEDRVDPTNTTAYYDFDAIGSTAGLTGGNGSYVNRYSYLPFGEDLNKVEAVSNPFEFVGQFGVMDEGNGLNFMRARFYVNPIGKFNIADPIGLRGGDSNFYNYVSNNPVSAIDPEGTLLTLPAAAIGAAIGAAVNTGFYIGGQVITGEKITGGGIAGALVSGGIQGGVTGATGGLSLAVSNVVLGAGANVAGSAVQQFIDGGFKVESIKRSELAKQAALGAIPGFKLLPKVNLPLNFSGKSQVWKRIAEGTARNYKIYAKFLASNLFDGSYYGTIYSQISDFLEKIFKGNEQLLEQLLANALSKILPPPPPHPENSARTFNDPRIVTFDKQYHDFQAAGEFTLIESKTGDLKIQVRQQPVGNNPRSNVSENTAVSTIIGGKRIGIYLDQGLFVDGVPTEIPDLDSLAVGDGRIYREGKTYTIVYPTGDQLVATSRGRLNIDVYLTKEREGQITGLLGNLNKNPKDDLIKSDGTVLTEPVSQQQLYGEYADSWRVNQAESLFDYKPGEDTNTFTQKNYPRQKVKISDLNPADVAKAEQLIGDRVKNPTIREATIIDLVLTNFDPDILEAAINSPDPESVLAIASPFTANSDFYSTPVNTPVKINVLANDTTTKDPLSIKEFNAKSVAGGTITLDNNNTPDDKSDDQLLYTPPPNFTGNDTFNYVLTDGKQIQVATVTVNTNSLKLSNLSGNNGFVVNGTDAGNFSGVAVSKTGDINGDKIDDIAIGSFGADPNGVNAAGKSQVIFGSQKFPATIDLSQLNGQNGFTLNGTDAEGFSGGSLSNIGDINGDGLSDFIIGAFGAAANGQNNAGKAYVVFGNKQGFPANFNLSTLNGNNGFAITGTNTFDYAGLSVSETGDINGDKINDLLISAPGPLGGTPGKSYVIYSRTTGFAPNLNLAEINGTNGFTINGIDGNSSGSVSSGDINGDRVPDLIIGADGGTTSGGNNAGKIYVILGEPGGFSNNVDVTALNGTTGFVIAGLSPEERAGIAISSGGDVNGDGIEDIVIGAPGATVNNQVNAGKTYVIFGTNKGFPLIVNPAELNGRNGFTVFGFDPQGSSGSAVSIAGDINKDGFDDVLIGASGANSDGKNNAGKTFVILGRKEFPASISLAEINGKNSFVLSGVEEDGLSGTAVSGAGDVNGDGIDDVIVGSPGSLFQNSPGKGYVVFGSPGFGFTNPNNNGSQGTVGDDILNGTAGDDTIFGGLGNDKIFGKQGQDVLSGNENDDYLDGEKGQDILIGGDGNDTLVGGLGNDVLKGENGNDVLTGVDVNAINPGIEEIDTLTGGSGSDIFVLGDANNVYYDSPNDGNSSDGDYALISDFNSAEDVIQLHGKASDYLLTPLSQGNLGSTAIFVKTSGQNELIGIVQGATNLSLDGKSFKFV